MAVTLNGSVLTAQATIGASPRTLTWASVVLTAGDIVVVEVLQNGAAGFPSPAAPTGGTGLSWTIVKDQQNTAAHFSRVTAYWSTVPSGQTSTITQVCTEGSNESTQGTLKRWSGADQTTPIGQTAGFQGQTDPTGASLQITGTLVGSQIGMAASDWSAGTAARTISISGTTGGVTDLDNLETGEFRAISARGAQSSSTNQGTLDYTAATGDWAAILYEIKAAPSGGGIQPARPGKTWQRRYKHRRFPAAVAAAAADFSAVGVTAALVLAAPTGAVSVDIRGPTASVVLAAPAGGASVDIRGPTATVVLAAPAGAASVTLPGVTATVVFAAPAGGFSTLTNFSANGVTATVVLAAPAGTVAVTLPGATGQLVLAAPAGKVSVTLPGATGPVVFAAPAGAVAVDIRGPTATVVLTAPAGVIAVTLPGATGTVVFAAPAGNFSTGAGNVSIPGVTATIVLAAPAGSVSVGLPGVTATVVFVAPAGKASVGINGPTATIVFQARTGGYAVNFTAVGVTAALVFTAPAGSVTTFALVTRGDVDQRIRPGSSIEGQTRVGPATDSRTRDTSNTDGRTRTGPDVTGRERQPSTITGR